MFTGLFLFVLFGFDCSFLKYFVENPTLVGDIATAVAIIAFPFGWFVYQIYDSIAELCDPHTSYKVVEAHCQKSSSLQKLDKNYYKAIVDYILIDDMYRSYPGLADTIRGFWDHYDARIVVGFFTPIVSIILSLIIFFINGRHPLLISNIMLVVIITGIFCILLYLRS
jgi:hypothetical protein